MHTPDDMAALEAAIDEALAALAGALDGDPAAELRAYQADLTEVGEVTMDLPGHVSADAPRLRLALSVPAWTGYKSTRVGVVLGHSVRIYEGIDIYHAVVEHEVTKERRQRFTLNIPGRLNHYHGVGPIHSCIRETARGPVLRMWTEVVECRAPKKLLAEAVSALMNALADQLDPEDFQ